MPLPLFIRNSRTMRNDKENIIRRIISEELSRSDVKSIIDSQISQAYKEREFKKKVRERATDVLDDFFHEMWRKKGFWKNSLK